MAQQNHNVSYLFEVDGLTVWEKLRVIRNFLEDREIALALAELPVDESTMTEREKLEAKICEPQRLKNIQNAKDEIKFLKEFEASLIPLAEKTRIKGKTDEEMYEINYYEELIERQLLQVKSEIMAVGRLSANTFEMLMKSPPTMERAISIGIISNEVKLMLENGSSKDALYKPEENTKMLNYIKG